MGWGCPVEMCGRAWSGGAGHDGLAAEGEGCGRAVPGQDVNRRELSHARDEGLGGWA